jgi:hypothetical protein
MARNYAENDQMVSDFSVICDALIDSLQPLDFPSEPVEIVEHSRNQFLSAGILRR